MRKDLLKLALKNKEEDPKAFDQFYEYMIVDKIRKRYNLNAELAILRQRDEKPDEFQKYHDFVEQCKAEVKAELGMTKEDSV